MSTIHDDELILFHYRDGLAPERMAVIATALATSPDLARRYQALERLLAAVDHDLPPAPDAEFEQRLWQRLQPRLEVAVDTPARDGTDTQRRASATVPAPPLRKARSSARPVTAPARSRRPRRRRRRRALALGAGLAATLVLAFLLQAGLPFGLMRERAAPAPSVATEPATPVPTVPTVATSDRHAVADRILVAHLSQHLRRTQGALQSVARTEGAALLPTDDAYLRALAHDNRLYAAAAERRGIRALAGFLRSLDPVLLELAHRSTADVAHDDAMRSFVRDSDLLFRIRAAHARLLARSDPHA